MSQRSRKSNGGTPRQNKVQNPRRRRRGQARPQSLGNPTTQQIGAVVRTRLTRTGVSDIRSLRITWVMGYTFVGNGTNGTANSVYFQTASSTWIVQGQGSGSSGQAPIAASDLDLGAAYVGDITKHFARKVVKRMWIHVDSLQPSTANNMMAVIGVSRGSGGGQYSVPRPTATAAITANTVTNVTSMKDSFPVDSWEHATMDISHFIAGGSGAKQNEFEIGSTGDSTSANIYVTSGVQPDEDLDNVVPACIAVAGNNTTTALQNTKVHQISIEQEVDLLDYLGGMSQAEPRE